MKKKSNIRLLASLAGCLLGCGVLPAQTYQLNALSAEWENRRDSTVLKLELSLETDDLKSFDHICVTPILSGMNQRVTLPTLRLNSKQAQKKWQRDRLLARRKGESALQTGPVVLIDQEKMRFQYRGAIAALYGAQSLKLELQKEVFQKKGPRIQNELLTVVHKGSLPAVPALPVAPVRQPDAQASVPSAPVAPVAPVGVSMGTRYKGSYLSPESDATDERNQKELNFSLDEARVMAEITPQMLSLRELYTVALSYKNQPEKFYRIIQTSVQIYPAHPVANQNAAAAALEQGNVEAAGRYLQVASHETLAYKSCRGIYELLCNNLYEGIRLLKSAKAEGSEEAAINLKLFFESNKPAEKH